MANIKQNKEKVRTLCLTALFVAIEIIFCFSPLGSLPVGPLVATLAHIPVLIAALLLGFRYAAVMGAVMGTCSFIVWNTTLLANPAAFIFTPLAENGNFWSVVICFVPRFLLPIIAVVIYRLLNQVHCPTAISAAISSLVATLLHSVMVLGLAYLCFAGKTGLSEIVLPMIEAAMAGNAVLECLVAAGVNGSVVAVLRYSLLNPDGSFRSTVK